MKEKRKKEKKERKSAIKPILDITLDTRRTL